MTIEALKAIISEHQGSYTQEVTNKSGEVEKIEKDFNGILILYCDNDKVALTLGGPDDTNITDDSFKIVGGIEMLVLDAKLLSKKTGKNDIGATVYVPCSDIQRVVCINDVKELPYVDRANLMFT